MIPQEKSAAITLAMRETFGVADFEDIGDLTGGRGANPVFRIVVGGSAFLLRINLRAGDLTRHYACMRAAAEAGLAPRVWYTSVPDRISITDFVEVAPFPITDALRRIPAALRSLHALPPFPCVPNHINTSCLFLINKGAAVDGFIRSFQTADVLRKGEIEEFLARREQLASIYPHRDPDMVSSHNDLFRPDNILFDGRRVWLVDWEAAFLNDRYADLAVPANFVVTNDSEESTYLQEYFGAPPDEYQQARFFLARQVAHMFYAMAYLLQGSSVTPIDWYETVPNFNDFHQRFWSGDIKLADSHTKAIYGRIHWERFLQNTRQGRFEEALRIVSEFVG